MGEVIPGLFGDVKYYIVGEICEKVRNADKEVVSFYDSCNVNNKFLVLIFFQTISLLDAGGAKRDPYLSGEVPRNSMLNTIH